MSFELLVQFLVLGATAVLFWIARRDLSSRVSLPVPMVQNTAQNSEDLEQLCATLESVVTDLSQRLTALEQKGISGPSLAFAGTAPPNAHYAPVYMLLDEGVTDASEISRRTGLSRGEVDLILGLRARQVL